MTDTKRDDENIIKEEKEGLGEKASAAAPEETEEIAAEPDEAKTAETGEAAADEGTASEEASEGPKAPEPQEERPGERKTEKRKKKKHPFLGGMVTGLLISLLLFCLYRGYITIPFFGGYTFTIFLPTYYINELLDTGDMNYRDVERKMKEIDRYLDEYYLYDKDPELMEDGAVAGMVYGLYEDDPYVGYYTSEDFESEIESIEGNYCGIGVTVMEDEEGGGLLILQVQPESPSEEAGLQPGDMIIRVDDTDIRGMDMNDVTTGLIKGPEGSTVEIGILRDGEELSFTCERRIIENISVHHSMLELPEGDIGYICIASFENNTDEQFDEALTELTDAGAEGIVLDLRDDLGGSVNAATNILDRILADDDLRYADEDNQAAEKGSLLFYQQDKQGSRRYYYAVDGKSCELPIVVLVNENSASASEIVTGCLKDYGYKVVGMNTYGKGIIQSLIQLSDGSAVEFTTAEYLLPGGYRLHGAGIAPDVEAEPSEELLENGADMDAPDPETDNMLKAAIDELLKEL